MTNPDECPGYNPCNYPNDPTWGPNSYHGKQYYKRKAEEHRAELEHLEKCLKLQ